MNERHVTLIKPTELTFTRCHQLGVFWNPALWGEYVAFGIFQIVLARTGQLVLRYSFTPTELNSRLSYHFKHLSCSATWRPLYCNRHHDTGHENDRMTLSTLSPF